MQLLADRVLIRRVEEQRLIHCTDVPKSLKGIVLAVGPGKQDEDGERIPLGVKPGDKVLFNSRWNDFSAGENVGTGADLSGALERPLPLRSDPMLHLVREADIFGIVPHFDMKVELLPDNAHAQYSQKIEIAGPWSNPANA